MWVQIATVNKLKQKLRNAVAEDNALAVPFLRLAINDGLGFSVTVGLPCCRLLGAEDRCWC